MTRLLDLPAELIDRIFVFVRRAGLDEETAIFLKEDPLELVPAQPELVRCIGQQHSISYSKAVLSQALLDDMLRQRSGCLA